ncbi:alkaline phosphatase family protein, partial [Pseudomonas canadensis]|nr:alkaline phosphatase family protein [Pseudomonas canadensis]
MPLTHTLPAVLAGPLLRRLEPRRLVVWLVGSQALVLTLRLHLPSRILEVPLDHCQVVPVGRHAFIHLIDVTLDNALPLDVEISYDLLFDNTGIADWAPHLLYANAQLPSFV